MQKATQSIVAWVAFNWLLQSKKLCWNNKFNNSLDSALLVNSNNSGPDWSVIMVYLLPVASHLKAL